MKLVRHTWGEQPKSNSVFCHGILFESPAGEDFDRFLWGISLFEIVDCAYGVMTKELIAQGYRIPAYSAHPFYLVRGVGKP